MDHHHHHHHQQQQLQQQLLQAQHQQQHLQHLRPVQVPQQPHHHLYNIYQQPYYPPRYPYPQPQQQQQQQHHTYNQSNYTNVYPQQPYPQPLPQSAVVQPLPVQPVVNPAAAVLSRLVQYSGAVGSQWTTPMVGQPPCRGIGEVGGELFRGHPGNFGYSHLGSVGVAHPSFVGGSHGRGRGGSWLLSEHGVPSTSSRPVPLVTVDPGAKTIQAGVSFRPPHQTDQPPVTLTPWKSESASTLKTEVPNYQKPQIGQTPPVALNPEIDQKPPVTIASTSSRPVPLVTVDSGAKTIQAGVSFRPPHQTDQPPVTLTPWKSESASTLKTEVPNYQKPQIAQTPPVALNPEIDQKPPVTITSTSSRPVPLVTVDSGAKTIQAGVSFRPPHQTDQPPVTLTPWKLESASTLKTEVPNYQKPQIAQTPPVALNPEIDQKPLVTQKTAVAWCEICNASCANSDVLKQHQNGRRHQRNLRKIEEVKNGIKTGAKLQGRQRRTSNTKLEVCHQTHCAQDGEDKKTTKNIPSEAVGHENSTETEKHNKNLGQSEMPLGDGSNNVKHSKKRKKMRTPKQPVEPSRRKVVSSIVCDLCNVKCETQEVFDRHLSGKKHFAKYKRFKGHEALYGPVGLQVLYPPNPMAETIFQPQEGRYMPPHVYQDIPVETSSDPQFQQNPTSQFSESIPGCGSPSAVTAALETNVTTEPEIRQEATIEGHHLNGISVTGQGSNPLSQDSILEPDKVIPVPQ